MKFTSIKGLVSHKHIFKPSIQTSEYTRFTHASSRAIIPREDPRVNMLMHSRKMFSLESSRSQNAKFAHIHKHTPTHALIANG